MPAPLTDQELEIIFWKSGWRISDLAAFKEHVLPILRGMETEIRGRLDRTPSTDDSPKVPCTARCGDPS